MVPCRFDQILRGNKLELVIEGKWIAFQALEEGFVQSAEPFLCIPVPIIPNKCSLRLVWGLQQRSRRPVLLAIQRLLSAIPKTHCRPIPSCHVSCRPGNVPGRRGGHPRALAARHRHKRPGPHRRNHRRRSDGRDEVCGAKRSFGRPRLGPHTNRPRCFRVHRAGVRIPPWRRQERRFPGEAIADVTRGAKGCAFTKTIC